MIDGYGLSFPQKIKKWYHQESNKLRPMPFTKKVDYIFTYYKLWMFSFIILLLFGWYVGDAVIQSRKEVLLEGFFTNDEFNLFDPDAITKEFSQLYPPDKNQSYVFDDTLYISLTGDATEYTAASKGKIIAYMATHELDFIITPEDVFYFYLDSNAVPMENIASFLPPSLSDELQTNLIQGTDLENHEIFAALKLSNCRFIKGHDEIDTAYYMFIPKGAPHPDAIVRFIQYLYS